MIFLDTPGIHQDAHDQYGSQKSNSINHRINSEAFASLRNADVILRLIDPTRPRGAEDDRIDETLSYAKQPIIHIETKQDIIAKNSNTQAFQHSSIPTLKIDSINKVGFTELLETITKLLPE